MKTTFFRLFSIIFACCLLMTPAVAQKKARKKPYFMLKWIVRVV